MLSRHSGVLLVSGPSGSGKTSIQYAMLKEATEKGINAITIENPVEKKVEGIDQVQIDPSMSFTYANALRHVLHHDPDFIMVGELNDGETAKQAFEAAQSGHLVLSSINTTNSASAVMRLMEMNVEHHMVSNKLLGVLSQQLIKVNCPHCIEEEEIDPDVLKKLPVDENEKFYKGRGCDLCDHTGYAGQTPVYELLEITLKQSSLLRPGVSGYELYRQAMEDGMTSILHKAIALARNKLTSLAEVFRIRSQ